MKCPQKNVIYVIYVVYFRTTQYHVLSILVMLISMEGINSEAKPDGIHLFCQPNMYICCEHIVLFLRSMFKFFGLTQFLEICATSKEVVLFYDNGFVLLRFA